MRVMIEIPIPKDIKLYIISDDSSQLSTANDSTIGVCLGDIVNQLEDYKTKRKSSRQTSIGKLLEAVGNF